MRKIPLLVSEYSEENHRFANLHQISNLEFSAMCLSALKEAILIESKILKPKEPIGLKNIYNISSHSHKYKNKELKELCLKYLEKGGYSFEK